MIDKHAFVNKLRELNYTFKSQRKRVDIWRKKGGTHMVSLPRCDKLAEDWVKSTLKQCGESDAEILAYMASVKS